MEYMQELVQAILDADKDKVQTYVNHGADVNYKFGNGDSALLIAARKAEERFKYSVRIHTTKKRVLDYIAICKILQHVGADATAENNSGHTARYYLQKLFWRSCEYVCIDIVNCLVAIEGIGVNLPSASGCTPLCVIGKSVEYENWELYDPTDEAWCQMLNLLLPKFSSGHTGSCLPDLLYRACTLLLPNTIKRLLSIRGIDVNYRQAADMNKTPIMELACRVCKHYLILKYRRHESAVCNVLSMLLEHGASIKTCDQNGVSVSVYLSEMLCKSVSMSWENITRTLLNVQGVDVNFNDKNQCQPLSLVGKYFDDDDDVDDDVDERCVNIYHLLLEKTNDIPWESLSQSLVRHVQRARTKTVKKLVSLPQVDVNYCDDGKTPIMCVGWYGGRDEQCCELYDALIQAGALNYSKSDELVQSLSQSLVRHVEHAQTKTVKKLVSLPQVDVNYCCGGKTPIMCVGLDDDDDDDYASDEECCELYNALIQAGALNYSKADELVESLSQSLVKHVKRAQTKTVKKLVSLPQVDVNYCDDGKTPIMCVGWYDVSDEQCCELYDALIQAGALNYSKSDELVESLSQSLVKHVKRAQTKTVKKLVSLPQVDVNYCDFGATPIMCVGWYDGSDEQCCEVYDALIQAGALNYSKSDKLVQSLSQSLVKYVKRAQTKTVKKLVSLPQVDVNYCDDGKTPIMCVGLDDDDYDDDDATDEQCCELYDVLIQAGALNYSKADELVQSLSQSLVKHVKRAQTKTVKKLVSLPQVDVNYCDDGKTPIMCVGWYDVSDEQCCELYDVLIQAGALNYSKADELVQSLSQSLVRHVKRAQTKTVKKLVSLPQVDVNYCDAGKTPIMCVGSCDGSDEQCCEVYDALIQAGALNYSKSDKLVQSLSQSLVRHVKRAQTKTVKKLVSLPQVDVNYCDDGKTPIMCVGLDDDYASDEQCCELYNALIQAGALNYSKADELVESLSQSLVRHAEHARTKTVKKLVSLPQVDVNYCDDGKTPVMCVGCDDGSDEQCCEVYDALIQADALNYSKSDELVKQLGETFHHAARRVQIKFMRKLLSTPGLTVDVNWKNEDGKTTIMVVGNHFFTCDDAKCAEVYDFLAKNGADLKATDKYGESARECLVKKLETVTQRGHFGQMAKVYDILGNDSSFPFSIRNAIQDQLISQSEKGNAAAVKKIMHIENVDVNHPGENGETALMVVGRLGSTDKECSEIYDVLLNCKNALTAKDLQGKSVLDYLGEAFVEACAKGHIHTFESLLKVKEIDKIYRHKRMIPLTAIGIWEGTDDACKKMYDVLLVTTTEKNEQVISDLNKAFHRAATKSWSQVLNRLLCEPCIKPNKVAEDGTIPLMAVAKNGGSDEASFASYQALLPTCDWSSGILDKQGRNIYENLSHALWSASRKCWPLTVQLLVNTHGVDLNYRADNGKTPIMAADITNGNPVDDDMCSTTYSVLLKRCDITLKDNHGKSVMEYLTEALEKAASKCYHKMCEVILSRSKMNSVPLEVVDSIIDDFDINDEDDRRCANTYQVLLNYLPYSCHIDKIESIRSHLPRVLLKAARWGWHRVVQVLTSPMVTQHDLIHINQADEKNRTAIMNLEWGDENFEKAAKIFALLQEKGADLTVADSTGTSFRDQILAEVTTAVAWQKVSKIETFLKLRIIDEHMLKDCTTESVKLLQPEVLKELLPYQQDIPNLWKEVHSTISHFDSNDKDIRCREVFVILMEHFCGYSRSNEEMLTALRKACKWGWNKTAELLIQNLPIYDIDCVDENGRTPIMNLDWSKWYNVDKAAKIYTTLQKHGASLDCVDNTLMNVRDIISSELCSAVEMNLQHKVKVLLGLPGININYKKNGKVPLMHIQWRNKPFEDCLQIEELLLAQNPNIDKVDDQGISARLYPSVALWRAIADGDEQVAVNLLNHERVDVNYQYTCECSEPIKLLNTSLSQSGLSILHVAAVTCCVHLVEVLIHKGANVLVIDRFGRTTRKLLADSYLGLWEKYKEWADKILNLLFEEEKKIMTQKKEEITAEDKITNSSFEGTSSTQQLQQQMNSLEAASIVGQEHVQFQEKEYSADMYRHGSSESVRHTNDYTGEDVFHEPLNLTSSISCKEDTEMIQAYPNGDFTDTAMEVVSITPLDSVSKNNTQKYTIKALDNNTLLPLSSAYLMPQIENNNESVVWHGNQTVSENEKKNNFVDSECETSDSSRSILQSADDFQNESTLSQYTSVVEQNTATTHQIICTTCNVPIKGDKSSHSCVSELQKKVVQLKQQQENKEHCESNILQHNPPSERKQNLKQRNAANPHRPHTVERKTLSQCYSFTDPIKKDVLEFITRTGFPCDENVIVPSLKRMENTARSVVRCLIGIFFSEDILASSSVYRDYSKYQELNHKIVEECIGFVRRQYTTVSREYILDSINQKCADVRKKSNGKSKVNVIQFQAPRSKPHATNPHVPDQTQTRKHTSTLAASSATTSTSSSHMPLQTCHNDATDKSRNTCQGNSDLKHRGGYSCNQMCQRKGSFSMTNENIQFGTNGQSSFNIVMKNCTVNFHDTKCQDMSLRQTAETTNVDTSTEGPPVFSANSVPSTSYTSSEVSMQPTSGSTQGKQEESMKRKQDVFDEEYEDHKKYKSAKASEGDL